MNAASLERDGSIVIVLIKVFPSTTLSTKIIESRICARPTKRDSPHGKGVWKCLFL